MAGLYDSWQDPQTKEIIKSFAIITISANPWLQAIGIKRMPVILTPGYERDWLKPDRSLSDVLHMLRRYPSEKMNGYPVSELINTPGVNEPSLITPVGDRLQREVKPEIRLTSNSRYTHKKKDAPSGSWGETRQSGH
jgi:putative SOS response-associated peptidase YedK